jgi:murein L,D-transpeptidase YafK
MKVILVILLLVLFQPLSQAAETIDNPSEPDQTKLDQSGQGQYEQDILKTIKKIQSQDLEQALDSTRDLLVEYPKSRLGQMIYADLLLAKVEPLNKIGFGISTDKAQYDFKHEIQQRWQHESNTEHLGLIPENILFLAKNQPYVIVVDQEKSRIYVFRNEQGTPVLEEDYFMSIGLKGYGKQKRGDQKTPVGIYHVTKTIDGAELPDLYGLGAFPISYPNVWDVRKKRTGGGIWIHGTPSNTYNRSPWASNGCIVVSNPDFTRIDKYINSGIHTPVIVAQEVKWLKPGEWQQQRKDMMKVLSSWITDWESNNHNLYREHYSKKDYFAYSRDFKSWDGYKKWVNRNKKNVKVEYSNLNIFNYPGEDNLVLMQFAQSYASNNLDLESAKEVYWHKTDNRWQIVYEGARSFPQLDTQIVQN